MFIEYTFTGRVSAPGRASLDLLQGEGSEPPKGFVQGDAKSHVDQCALPRFSDRFVKKNIGGGVADRQEGGGAAGTNM